MTDVMMRLKAHAAYYRKCEADAMTSSQAAIAELQAKALEHAIESIGALPDLAPKVKPLEWVNGEAKGGGAKYNMYEVRDGLFNCVVYPHEEPQYRIAEKASEYDTKAAAQAHHDALILSALVAHGEE